MKKSIVLTCESSLPKNGLNLLKDMFDLRIAPCRMSENETIDFFSGAEGIIMGGEEVITEKVASFINPEFIVFLGIQPETSFEPKIWNKFKNKVLITGGGEKKVAKTTVSQIKNYLSDSKLYNNSIITIIGAGPIGTEVLNGLKDDFSGRVFYSGIRGEKHALKNQGFEFLRLETAFRISMVVSLHLRLVPGQTENLIKKKHLFSMPDNSLLVNNARAGLVEFYGLRNALKARKNLRIIFDTYYPDRQPDELTQFGNFVFTGHSAASSSETKEEYFKGLLKAIKKLNL